MTNQSKARHSSETRKTAVIVVYVSCGERAACLRDMNLLQVEYSDNTVLCDDTPLTKIRDCVYC